MTSAAWYEDVPVPSLMRDARDVYRHAVLTALAGAGCDDVPHNGVFVLGDLDQSASDPQFRSQGDVVTSLGLSKQAASQLIDTLVLREFVERRNDPVDRRRMEIRLTDRGRTAAAAIRKAVDEIEEALRELVSEEVLQGLRAGLAAFRALRQRSDA